jgi:hypothetical protein
MKLTITGRTSIHEEGTKFYSVWQVQLASPSSARSGTGSGRAVNVLQWGKTSVRTKGAAIGGQGPKIEGFPTHSHSDASAAAKINDKRDRGYRNWSVEFNETMENLVDARNNIVRIFGGHAPRVLEELGLKADEPVSDEIEEDVVPEPVFAAPEEPKSEEWGSW